MSELGIIEDGALLVTKGVIEHVGPTRRLENLSSARKATVIDATGMTILPGLIDPDCYLSPPDLKKSEQAQMEKLGAIIRFGVLAMDSVAGPLENQSAELKSLRANHHLQAKYPNLISTFAPHDTARLDLPKLLHEEAFQFLELRPSENWTPQLSLHWAERAAQFGFLMKARSNSLSHCQNLPIEQLCFDGQANEKEIRWAAGQRWILSASPAEALRQGGRRSQWRLMINEGVALALSTGKEGLNGSASMQLMLSLACIEMGLSIAEAITAATINAAHALGIQAIAGSLEPGKRADLIILDVPSHHEIPYHLGVNLVSRVMHHGKILFERTELEWPGA